MQSTAFPLSIQPLLFTSEELSGCFFTEPTDEELSFLEMWENLVSVMQHEVRCDDGRSYTGRPGYSLMDVLAVHAVKLYFRERTMSAARERLLSSINLRTMTVNSRGTSPAVISKKTGTLIKLIDFNQIIASVCSSYSTLI